MSRLVDLTKYSSRDLVGPDASEARWLCGWCGSRQPVLPIPSLRADVVLRLAQAHRLAAVAGSRLHAHGIASLGWQRALIRQWRQALGDEALFRDVLGRLDERLAAEGVPFLVLKGADLAHRGLYAAGERAHNDLDLLVEPGALAVVRRVLLDLGFHDDYPTFDTARADWFASTYRHRELTRVQIDLHDNLGAPGRGRWDVPGLLIASDPFSGWKMARRLRRADLWAHLALHAVAYHGASGRWIWWLDLHRLRQQGEVSAPEWRTVREHGATIALQAALLRAAALFDIEQAVDVDASWRARLVARCGARFDSHGGTRTKRWFVGALSTDRPSSLAAAAWNVARRWGSF